MTLLGPANSDGRGTRGWVRRTANGVRLASDPQPTIVGTRQQQVCAKGRIH